MTPNRLWQKLPLPYRLLRSSAGDPFAVDGVHGGMLCVRGQGYGRYLIRPVEGCTLFICIRGTLSIDSVDSVFQVRRRHFLCLPSNTFSKLQAEQGSDWVALRFPPLSLRKLVGSHASRIVSEPLLLPVILPLGRQLMRCVVEFLRVVSANEDGDLNEAVGSMMLAATQLQSETLDWVRRAPGRSERHRRQAVVRLLSARNRIVNAPFYSHDLDTLAAAAMYSPSHFLRSFRDVFGSTPHGLLMETRMEMARELMTNSDLAIREVAASVGYGSRHAFSRLFKRQTGTTATNFRLVACAQTDT